MGVEVSIRDLFDDPTPAGLAGHLNNTGQARPAVRSVPRTGTVPLSFAQRRLWFLHRMEGPSATYNIPLALRLSGSLDIEALEAAVGDVIARHESLRTVFAEVDGEPCQVILEVEDCRPRLRVSDVTETDLTQVLSDAAGEVFDLGTDVPLRTQLFRVDEHEHVLLVLMHHIASDGWSLSPLSRALFTAYSARCADTAPNWQPLPVQYADYAAWQRELLGDENDPDSLLFRQMEYWRGQLADLPDQLALPTDRPRQSEASYRGQTFSFEIDAATHRLLLRVARQNNATLFAVLQAGLAALLTKLGAGTDIPIGSPIAGRTDDSLDELVGFFVNTLVLRTDTSGDPTFRDLLARVRETTLEAYTHQDVPFEYLVDVVNPIRSANKHPLFQVMLALQNTPEAVLREETLEVHPVPVWTGTAKFDLLMGLVEGYGSDGAALGLSGVVEYSSDLFDRCSVERLVDRFIGLLQAVVANPEQRVG
ncbi:condensation domain-containing protein, partial [Nocardia rhamnosiphila]|uniref:condensation domain-containing protein n=1 Tax=Nocardia rhamnosiphila TaxID=426716 RepID=UPI0033F2AF97